MKIFLEKVHDSLVKNQLRTNDCNAQIGDSIFMAWKHEEVNKLLSIAREKIAKDLNLIDEKTFCWIMIIQCLN